jgi:hypothetical protein
VTDHSSWVRGSGFGSWCVDLPLCSAPGVVVPLSGFVGCSGFDVCSVLAPFGGCRWFASYLAGVVPEL